MAYTGTARGTGWGGAASNTSDLLLNYVSDYIKNLEPNLEFAKFGVHRDIPKGFDRLAFPQVIQYVTASAGTITEGTTPTVYATTASTYTGSVTQKGMVTQVSDLLVHGSAIEVVDKVMEETKNAMARQLDAFLQATVNAGTSGVNYAGGRSTRATLGAGDIMDTTLFDKCIRDLRKAPGSGGVASGVKPFANGAYAVIMDPSVAYDLRSNTNAGSWNDVSRYTSPESIKKADLGHFRGGMVYETPNITTFSSTQTVHPVTFLGQDAFGWGFSQPITPILVNTADSNNPLNLYTSIGAKMATAVTLFENSASLYRIVRAECAVSS